MQLRPGYVSWQRGKMYLVHSPTSENSNPQPSLSKSPPPLSTSCIPDRTESPISTHPEDRVRKFFSCRASAGCSLFPPFRLRWGDIRELGREEEKEEEGGRELESLNISSLGPRSTGDDADSQAVFGAQSRTWRRADLTHTSLLAGREREREIASRFPLRGHQDRERESLPPMLCYLRAHFHSEGKRQA